MAMVEAFGIIYLVFFVLFVVSSFMYIHNNSKEKYSTIIAIIFLLLIGLFVGLYVREMVYGGSILATTDEANYLANYYECNVESDCSLSGPGYGSLLELFYSLFPSFLSSGLYIFSLIITTITLPFIFLIINRVTKNISASYLATIFLLSTNYLIYPLIEGRPQQIGMLFVVLVIYYFWFIYNETNDYFKQIFLFVLLTALYYFHMISFLITIAICICLSAIIYLNNKKEKLSNIISLLSYGLFMIILFGFEAFPYSEVSQNVKYSFNQSSSLFLTTLNMAYPLPLILAYLITALVLIICIILLKNKAKKIMNLVPNFINKNKFYFFIFLTYIILFAFFFQFVIRSDIYLGVYNNSFLLMLLLQIPNIIITLVFVYVLTYLIKIKDDVLNSSFFMNISFCYIILGAITLALSLVMTTNFDNWMIRVINYSLFFIIPFMVLRLYPYLIKRKTLIVVLLILLIIPSMIVTSKDPSIFDTKVYWDEYDFAFGDWIIDVSEADEIYYLLVEESSDRLDLNYNKFLKYIFYAETESKNSVTLLTIDDDYESLNRLYDSGVVVLYSGGFS